MRLIAPFLAAISLLSAPPPDVGSNPQEIAKWAVRNYQKSQLGSLRYEYNETDEKKGKGAEVSHVTTLSGTPYERLISKGGEPLTGKAEENEQQKFEKTRFKRLSELKGQRDLRERKWKEENRFLEEAPDAFIFKLLPEESVNGRPVYVLEATPKPGFEPKQDRSKMFTKIQAKAWVDKQDLQIVKIEAETQDPVSIGWVLARIGKGTHLELEQMRLDDGNWVLKKLAIEGQARVLLVDNRQLDETVVYSDYRLDPKAKPVK